MSDAGYVALSAISIAFLNALSLVIMAYIRARWPSNGNGADGYIKKPRAPGEKENVH